MGRSTGRNAIGLFGICLGAVVERGVTVDFSRSKDASLLVFYENIRRQVEADMQSGGRYRFAGDSVRQYADKLREEMDRPNPVRDGRKAETVACEGIPKR
jgi:hypothetical protein